MNNIEVGDVVQVDPESAIGKEWGPQLVIVTDPRPWGVKGYFLHAQERGDVGPAYIRLPNGSFERVGRAVWMVNRE